MSILINLRSVITEGVGASISNSGTYDPGVLELGELKFHPTQPASWEATFVNAGEGVHTSGTVSLDARTLCVRCLREFDLRIESRLEEIFYREPTTDDHGEALPVIGDDDTIDIEPLLRESLMVELPFAPLHDADCKGLCSRCGTDLNEGDCSCAELPDPNHPFAKLSDLL